MSFEMNMYELALIDGIKAFSDHGLWVKNVDLKVGYSYIAIEIHSNGIDVESEDEDVAKSGSYYDFEDFFGKNPGVEFVITRDWADRNSFITWREFKDKLMRGQRMNICTI